ncbi:MAG: hypothetical protein LBL13_08875 [Bacteroidales bacterium]|nr:hypothetical protein [Bacteroidales bacterium]
MVLFFLWTFRFKLTALGNALCRKRLPAIIKSQWSVIHFSSFDYALTGLGKYCVHSVRRALPYAVDYALSELFMPSDHSLVLHLLACKVEVLLLIRRRLGGGGVATRCR